MDPATARSHADDLRRYARDLDDAASATAAVIAALAGAWADATGRQWAERLRLVGRELDHLAGVARDQADAADRHAADDEPTGVVLGAQTGTRTTGRRGVVVPTLPVPVLPP